MNGLVGTFEPAAPDEVLEAGRDLHYRDF